MLNYYRKNIPLWTNFITALFSFNIGWFFGRKLMKKRNSSNDFLNKSIDDLEKGLKEINQDPITHEEHNEDVKHEEHSEDVKHEEHSEDVKHEEHNEDVKHKHIESNFLIIGERLHQIAMTNR